MKKKFALALSVVLAGSTFLGACSSDKDNKKEEGGKEAAKIKVGMVTDTGGVDDKSFNQSTWEGLQQFAKDNGLKVGEEVKYAQSTSDADYIPNLTQFAQGGFDLTYGVGFLLADAVKEVADQHPDQNFAIIDSVVEGKNIASISFKEHEGSFLVGVVAAMTTKTDKVGFVGGVDSDLIKKFEIGFKAGVQAVNPKIKVIAQYAGDFGKPEKGASIAASIYGQGADIIYHAAGGTGNGVFQEAKNRSKNGEKVWVIGVDRDQHAEGLPEDVTLTSMVKRVDLAAQIVSKQALDGKFPGGQIVEFGLDTDGVGIATNPESQKNVSKEALAKVEEFSAKIKDGSIKVPANEKELKAFKL